jgi:hypothetical protein
MRAKLYKDENDELLAVSECDYLIVEIDENRFRILDFTDGLLYVAVNGIMCIYPTETSSVIITKRKI